MRATVKLTQAAQ